MEKFWCPSIRSLLSLSLSVSVSLWCGSLCLCSSSFQTSIYFVSSKFVKIETMEKRTYWSSNPELPVGCQFNPTDQQLILDYLLNKVNNDRLPSPTSVIDCDVYGERIAWRRLFEESEEDSLYFFTRLKKKTGKSKRVDRVTDCGTWKGQQRDKETYTHGDQRDHFGSRRSFCFIPKKGFQENRGKWEMHEYRLAGCLLDKNNFYVVCRVNKNKKVHN